MILNRYRNKINYYSSHIYSIPKGVVISFGSKTYIEYEKCGFDNIGKCGFILVAGGLGERLHIEDIKVSMKFNMLNNYSYIEYYCQFIKMFEQNSKLTIPFCIMTSDYTHELFLSSNNYFGLNKNQFYIIKQSSVPCFCTIDGDLEYRNKFILKPHGHGDIHHLLYKNKILENWINKGIENVIIFQDTNALGLNSVYALLGACRINMKEVLFLSTDRYVGEKASVICLLQENNRNQFRAVDYCRLPSFSGEDINKVKEGIISEFPGVTNIICFDIYKYNKTLQNTKGILPNFVLPKIDQNNNLATPVRLESVLQDYPLLLSNTSKVDHLKMERWLIFNPLKESSQFNHLYSFNNSANLFNEKFIKCLEYIGCKIGKKVRLFISPSTAIRYEEYVEHFSKDICINDNSSLQIYGNVYINRMLLNGNLIIKVKEGCKVIFDSIIVNKYGNIEININRNCENESLNL